MQCAMRSMPKGSEALACRRAHRIKGMVSRAQQPAPPNAPATARRTTPSEGRRNHAKPNRTRLNGTRSPYDKGRQRTARTLKQSVIKMKGNPNPVPPARHVMKPGRMPCQRIALRTKTLNPPCNAGIGKVSALANDPAIGLPGSPGRTHGTCARWLGVSADVKLTHPPK